MPFQDPVNRGRIVSSTVTVASGATSMVESKRSMTSVRCAATSAGAASTRSAATRTRMLTTDRRERSETDLRRLPLRRVRHLEELAGLEAEHPGDDVRGERLDLRVEVADDGVVVAARVLDRILDLGQRALERAE